MLVSVVICAYKRPDMLVEALDSLKEQSLSTDRFEVIVVDNNSGPPIPELVTKYVKTSGYELRYVLEKSQGISHARNSGVLAAKGEIIAFLDDDEVADEYWLTAHLDVYHQVPDVSAIVGKALPLWESEAPKWLTDWRLIQELNMINWGDEVHRLTFRETLGTGNSSFRRELFDEMGMFDTSLAVGEDIDMQRRMEASDKLIYYTPYAVVHHHVKPERARKRHFYRTAFARGKQRASAAGRRRFDSLPDEVKPQGNTSQRLFQRAFVPIGYLTQQGLSEQGRVFLIRHVFYLWGFVYETIRTRLLRRPDPK